MKTYTPTEKQIRCLLSAGYPDYLLVQLDRGLSGQLISALVKNNWSPLEWEFPNGEKHLPTSRPTCDYRKAPLPECLSYCQGSEVKSSRPEKPKCGLRRKKGFVCDKCREKYERRELKVLPWNKDKVVVCVNCLDQMLCDAFA